MVQGVGWVMQGVAKETFSQVVIVKIGCGGENMLQVLEFKLYSKHGKLLQLQYFVGLNIIGFLTLTHMTLHYI